jgi:hypothetical protein
MRVRDVFRPRPNLHLPGKEGDTRALWILTSLQSVVDFFDGLTNERPAEFPRPVDEPRIQVPLSDCQENRDLSGLREQGTIVERRICTIGIRGIRSLSGMPGQVSGGRHKGIIVARWRSRTPRGEDQAFARAIQGKGLIIRTAKRLASGTKV